MIKKYDVIVIGTGGGTKIVRPAANLGKKVAVIEKDKLGGTCLNRGCIPSKMLIHPAEVMSEIAESSTYNISVDTTPTVDFTALVSRINTTIDADSDSIAPVYNQHENIDYYHGEASFIDEKTIQINGELITGDMFFLTVGVRTSIPDIMGLKETPFWTSTDALRNTTLPKSLIVIGGGYIGVELGYAYSALGAEVTFLVRNRMISFEDNDIVDAFEHSFSKRESVRFGDTIRQVSYQNGEFIVVTTDKQGSIQTFKSEQLLVATGVTSNADTLHLDHTGIKTDQNGFITVDDGFETTQKNVFAYGDVIGRYMFRHTVNYEGEYLFNRLFLNKNLEPISYPPIPHAIFTHPQVAGVGKTERDLVADGTPYIKVIQKYKNSAMGMALLSEDDFVKVLVNKETRRLEGVHIMGKEASNMVHMAIAYMKMNATIDDIMDTIFIHPAINEIFRNAIRKAHAEL